MNTTEKTTIDKKYIKGLQSAVLYGTMNDLIPLLIKNNKDELTIDIDTVGSSWLEKLQAFLTKNTNKGTPTTIIPDEFQQKITLPVKLYIEKELLPHYKNKFITPEEFTTFETYHKNRYQKLGTETDIINCFLSTEEYSRGINSYLSDFITYIGKNYNIKKITIHDLINKIEPEFINTYHQEKSRLYENISSTIVGKSTFKGSLINFYNDGYPICKKLSTSTAERFLTYLQSIK